MKQKFRLFKKVDALFKRFPLVHGMVLRKLDDQSLFKSKEVIKGTAEFLNNGRFYWIRIIKKNIKHFEAHEKSWQEAITKTPSNTLKELAVAVEEFFKSYCHFARTMAPLHILTQKGSFKLCQYIITKTQIKNPAGKMTFDFF